MKKMVLTLALMVHSLAGLAGVNPKNGDFYISYKDLSVQKNGQALEILRTYNSLSTSVGWFGYGWGSRLETRLIVLPDGSAVIRENGNGRDTFYRTGHVAAIQAGVQRIVDAATRKDGLTPEAAAALATRLLGDERLRVSSTIQYAIQSELQDDGALEDECGKGNLVRVPEGYRRLDCNRFGDSEPAVDTFDAQGRLIRHELRNGYAVLINHSRDGTSEIRDTLGQRITLARNPDGQVVKAEGGENSVTYTYDGTDLVGFNDPTDNSYGYSYDRQHNLTQIRYIDDSKMFISYSPGANGRADAVTERDGTQHTYVYRSDPQDPSRYSTTLTVTSPSGKTSTRVYEYQDRTSSLGVTQPSRIVAESGSGIRETQFDEKGRTIRKGNSDGGYSDYIYHGDKLILVLKKDQRTEFHYDAKGKLIQAANSKGKIVDIFYGEASDLICSMVVSKNAGEPRRELKFKYNENGKPVDITLVGVGNIHVAYGEDGEISKVESKDGANMALQVLQAFQDLMSMVAVASANL